MSVMKCKSIWALLAYFKTLPILVPSVLIESTKFPHSLSVFHFRPFEEEVRNGWMVTRMLTENTSPIFKIPLVGLSKQRIKRLQLFRTSIHPSDHTRDHQF